MEAYTGFAQVYDLFMDNVPYEEWAGYIQEILLEDGIKDGILLDLGCGTGKLTRIMAEKGFDMIGVDNSMEMLDMAREYEYDREEPSGILYLLQDMREFELYGTVRGVYCACDSLNYILEEEELLMVFKLVNNYLDPKGLFIFDMNTDYKYEELLADHTIAENREESSFIWDNYYDKEEQINEYDLTLFIREEEDREDGMERFLRFTETHFQRCYSFETVKKLLLEAGLEFVAVYDAYTKNELRSDSERMTIIAREHGKKESWSDKDGVDLDISSI